MFGVAFILLLIVTFAVSNKQLGHVDEFYTYALANSGFMGRNHTEIFEKSLHWYAYNAISNSIAKKSKDDALLKDLKNSGIISKNQDNPFKNDFEQYAFDVMRLNYESAADKTRHIIWDTPLMFFMFDGDKKTLSPKDVKNIMMPNDEAKFNFASVFWNQSFDVHPPLYYVAINIICSLFYNNGEFSPWHGLAINLVFFFFTLPLVYCIACSIFDKNHGLSLFAMIVYGFMAGGGVAFLRMYIMFSFFTVLYTALILSYFKGEITKTHKFCLALSIIFGSLTHHYFLVYLGITGFFLSLYLIYTRKINFLFNFVKISGFSVIISLLIFPFTLIHIFFNEHGAVDILYKLSNMSGIEAYLNYIVKYFSFMFEAIFVESPFFVIIFVTFGFFIVIIRNRMAKSRIFFAEICFLFVTLILYVAFVAITTKYQEERYITNIYPIAAILSVFFFNALYDAIRLKVNLKPILALILLVFTAYNFNSNVSKYLYLDISKRYETVKEYKNKPCVYIYDENERQVAAQIFSLMLIKEFELYSYVYFVEYRELQNFLSKFNEKSAVIYFYNAGNTKDTEIYFKNKPNHLIVSEYDYKVYEVEN